MCAARLGLHALGAEARGPAARRFAAVDGELRRAGLALDDLDAAPAGRRGGAGTGSGRCGWDRLSPRRPVGLHPGRRRGLPGPGATGGPAPGPGMSRRRRAVLLLGLATMLGGLAASDVARREAAIDHQ